MRIKGASGWDSQMRLFRGRFQAYMHPQFGWVVTKWPRKRGKKKTAGQAQNNADFAQVVAWCKNPLAGEVEVAQSVTSSTGYLWRDYLESCCYGLGVECVLKDGTILFQARAMSGAINNLLDSITDAVGTMLVRTSAGWAAITPLDAGTVLTSNGSSQPPTFQAASGGGGSSPVMGIGGLGSNSYGTKLADIAAADMVAGAFSSFGGFGAVPGASGQPITLQNGHLYRFNWFFIGGNGGANAYIGDPTTGTGFMVGEAGLYYAGSGQFSSLTNWQVGRNLMQRPWHQQVELYLYIDSAPWSYLWANGPGQSTGEIDTSDWNGTTNPTLVGFAPAASPSAFIHASAYDLGQYPTS